MKSVLKFALALPILVGLVAQASAASMTSCPPKPGIKITKRWQLHDGCHSRYAQMLGKPCH